MMETIDKWQASVLVLAAIVALVILALFGAVPAELVVGSIGGIPSLVLGAGAVAHGVRQGSKAATPPEPPAGE